MYNVEQQDIDILRQRAMNYRCKIQLLNEQMMILDEMEGAFLEGSVTIDSSSDIRRTLNARILLNDDSYLTKEYSRIWLDKRIRVYVGCDVVRTGETRWYSLGVFDFNDNSFTIDEATQELNIGCVDMMSEINGELKGTLSGLETRIEEGNDIRTAIIRTITQLGEIKKYRVEYESDTIPYDLEFNTGATVWNILQELRDLYYSYEMYFDEDVFVCQRVPMNNEYPVVLQNEQFERCVISENLTNQFAEVKNIIQVYGESTRNDYYSDNVSYSGGVYTVNVANAEMSSGKRFSFVAPEKNGENASIKIVNTVNGNAATYGPFAMVQMKSDRKADDVPLGAGKLEKGKYYVFKYDGKQAMAFVGQSQIQALCVFTNHTPTGEEIEYYKEKFGCDNMGYIVNPESPFTVEKIGERFLMCSGNDYAKISTDELAMERAEYEIYLHARLTDSLSLQMQLIPWLDVNDKVEYAPLAGGGQVQQFIIQNINFSIGEGTMNITMARFYPFYPNTVHLADTKTETGGGVNE